MSTAIQPADLGFFSALASAGSLSAAARELGVTTPAVSKHLALMESRVGVSLVNRTTRRMSLTPEGELYLAHARRILGEINTMEELLGVSKETLGFGRSHIAPLPARVRTFVDFIALSFTRAEQMTLPAAETPQ